MSGQEITITVDGREIIAREGQMLVDAAKQGDVEIPVFCYEPKLGPPVGACRMCLVEIEGIPKLQTACSTPVRDGMVVHTRNEQVTEAQNAIVEFLLINHPLDCPVCDKGGECPLQDISMGWGTGRSRFTDPKRHFEKPTPLSPLVAIDRERCILCYRCVRFSQEISEDGQLHFLERGDRTFVGTFDDRPYIAPFHGNITELCPVGALTNYTYRFRARPWDVEEGGSLCTLCPSQCNVKYTVRDEGVKRVLARDNEEVDDGWLCDRGRYGFEMWSSDERITRPQVRESGSLRDATWAEALEKAAEGLRATGGATAALLGDASNEEGHLLQRLMRETLGSGDIDSRLRPGAARNEIAALSEPSLSVRTRALDAADAILVLGTDPLQSSPILDLRIRKAVRRNGTKLAVASDHPTSLDGGAVAGARYALGHGTRWISGLASAIRGELAEADSTPEIAEMAEILRDAGEVVVIWGERLGAEQPGVGALLELARALELEASESSGLLEVPDSTNARGLREVGALPDAGPGLTDLASGGPTPPGRSAPEIREALESDQLRGLIAFGCDPVRDAPNSAGWKAALNAADFTVAFSMFANETTATAEVVFPLESPAEKEGTVTHPDGRLQRVRPNAKRPGDVRSVWQILAELSAMLGNETGVYSAPDALAAIAADVPFYSGITPEEIGGQGIRWQERPQASGFDGVRGGPVEGDRAPSNSAASGRPLPDLPATQNGLALGTYRDLWAGSVTEHNPALGFLKPAQRLELAPDDAVRLGLAHGDHVEIESNGAKVMARALIRERMRPGAVFLLEGTRENNANELSGADPAALKIERVEPPVELEVQRVSAT